MKTWGNGLQAHPAKCRLQSRASRGAFLRQSPIQQLHGNGIKVAVWTPVSISAIPSSLAVQSQPTRLSETRCKTSHGHGTHTTGTACGPQSPSGPIQRYGIGYRTQIFVGKVLSQFRLWNPGAGFGWYELGHCNKCAVISMSLGARYHRPCTYTAAGTAALNAGCLIIAASGNASSRPGNVQPAGAPANSPSIMLRRA